jgi:hypothetical protein
MGSSESSVSRSQNGTREIIGKSRRHSRRAILNVPSTVQFIKASLYGMGGNDQSLCAKPTPIFFFFKGRRVNLHFNLLQKNLQ